MSFNLNKAGAIAALIETATFVFGFVLLLTTMAPYVENQNDVTYAVSFVLQNHHILYVWNLVIYLLFGVCLMVLVLALHHRLKADSPILSQLAMMFGLVWSVLVIASGMIANVGLNRVVEIGQLDPALAESLWLSIHTIVNGLGGGNEIVGGIWVLLISVAAWQAMVLPRLLIVIGMVAGVAGVLTTLLFSEILGALFGIALIVWFACVGIAMLMNPEPTAEDS